MPIKVIGHRGSSAYYPDNSIEGLLHAIKVGADAVEIDIQQTVDGEQVLFHDDNIRGTPINKLSYAELSRRATIHPVRLAEALETIKGKIFCDAEIKISVGANINQILQTFQDILPDDQYHIKSFEEVILLFLRKTKYPWPVALNIGYENIDLLRSDPEEVLGRIRAISPYQIHPAKEFMSTWVAKAIKSLNLPLWVWTVDVPEEIEHFMHQEKVAGIITNCLPETLAIRSKAH